MLFGVALIAISCLKDEDIESFQEKRTNVSGFSITEINMVDIQRKGDLTGKGPGQNLMKNGADSQRTYNSIYNFQIDTDYATYIESEDGSYHSYTFLVIREVETDTLENLLLSLQKDGSYAAFLVTYLTTAEEKLDLQNGIKVDLMDKMYFTSVDDYDFISNILADKGLSANISSKDAEQICLEMDISTCGCNVHDDTTGYEDCLPSCYGVQTIYLGCYTPAGGDGEGTYVPDTSPPGPIDTTNGNDGTNNGGTGSNGNTTDDGTEDATTPVVSATQSIINCINGPTMLGETDSTTLSDAQVEWVNGQLGSVVKPINNYLKNNTCSEEAQEFAIAVIEAGDGAEVDYLNEVILDSTFMNNDKTKCTYEVLKENVNFKELIENFTGEESPNLTFKIIPDLQCNNSNDPNGCTSSNLDSNNSITISLDQEYLNSNQTPTLFIAETIVHEAIHANLYLALYNHEQGNLANLPNINDFPAIYEQYRQYKGWQHEFMAGEYTNLIAQILQEIHLMLNDQMFLDSLEDYDMTLTDFYTCIAYIGLNDTIGQTNFLSDPTNEANYNLSYYDAQANSTKTPNCN